MVKMHELLFPGLTYENQHLSDEEKCLTFRPTFTLIEQTKGGLTTMRATWTDLEGRPCSRMTGARVETPMVITARERLYAACLQSMYEGRG